MIILRSLTNRILQFSLGTVLVLAQTSTFAADDPKAILEEADRARGGIAKGASWSVKLDSMDDGDTSSTTYRVRAKGNNAYVEVIEPARSKGEVLLFNDRTIWFYKPTLKKPVAISARQRLSGQAANGDIASTNYARDYEGKIVGEEKVDGEDCFVVELKAIAENTSYFAIKYWVSKKKRLGLKSEFLSMQGKALKIATMKYGNTVGIEGKVFDFVSELKIVDVQNAKNFSVMTYTDPKVESSPDNLFNVNNLQR